VAQTHLTGPQDLPDDLVLQLHRYLWQPACYAHSGWFTTIGFLPQAGWYYGLSPRLDRCLNEALRAQRGTPRLPAKLNAHQRRIAQLAPCIASLALALGLLLLDCHDYFLLPDYRQAILHRLDEALIWQLFGLCSGKKGRVFSPDDLMVMATRLGTSVLYRAAQNDPVLYAVLITFPPCERALWPPLPTLAMNSLERILCPTVNSP